jgi:mRNA interferase MazF
LIYGEIEFRRYCSLKIPIYRWKNIKRRPALIINDFNVGDIIVCRITSQIYKTQNDIYIDDWEKSGLKLPSVIRVHNLATLEKDLAEIKTGHIDNLTKEKVQEILNKLTD